jgi:hypothetical protein
LASLLLPALAGSVACGKTLGTLTEQAMDGCIAARNTQFTSGKGTSALDTPLPDSVAKAADRIAYARALVNFQRIAEMARDQVTLVCALELASHYKNGDVGVLLWTYTKHPDAAVAASATRLLQTTQDPLPASYGQ